MRDAASNDERWGSVYDDLMRGRVVGPVEDEWQERMGDDL